MSGKREIGGATSTGAIKIIALVFMFCDHAGKMLLPNVPEMRMLGRIAFPLYAWCMVVGVCYTSSIPKYLLRTLLVGLVSQPLYIVALNHTWSTPNIFMTLALGLAAMWGIREKKYGSQFWAPLAALELSILFHVDYGWRGVLVIILLYMARRNRCSIAAVMIAYCMFWGSNSSVVNSFFGIPLTTPWQSVNMLLAPWLRLQALAIFSLPLMLWDLPWKAKMPHWLSYSLYPAHLALLWLLEQLV